MRKPRAKAPGVPTLEPSTIGTVDPMTQLHPDPERADQIRKVFSRMMNGSNNPLWNDQEELTNMVSVGMGSAETMHRLLSFVPSSTPSANTFINERFSKRHTVADMNLPRNPLAVLQMSLRYAMENPFVGKAAKVKRDFICKNFRHRTHNTAAKNFYDDAAVEYQIYTILPKIVWSLVTTGMAPLYWGGEDGGKIDFLQLFNPLSCEYFDINGKSLLFIKIDQGMVDAVNDPTGKKNIRNRLLFESMPQYWKDQIAKQLAEGNAKGLIELKEGSYSVVQNRTAAYNRANNTLDGVPLQNAFDALQRYRLFAAGDFANAWNVKNMITLISEGDPKADPKTYIPMNDTRRKKLEAQFLQPDYALTIFCDPTTKVEFVIPPLDVFKQDKYRQCEREILTVMNLPSFMWDTEGNGTFGAAIAETQLLVEEVEAIRMILQEQFFRPFYNRLRAGATRPGFKAKDIPLPVFDKSSLKDQATWLQNVGELYARGLLSVQTALEENGFDPEWEIEQKKSEHEEIGNTSPDAIELNNTPMRPMWQSSQGDVQPNEEKGGRPERKDKKGNPSDKNQNGGRASRPSGR